MQNPLDAMLWNVMGATIAVLWVATFVIAVLLVRQPLPDRATRYAVRLGIGIAACRHWPPGT